MIFPQLYDMIFINTNTLLEGIFMKREYQNLDYYIGKKINKWRIVSQLRKNMRPYFLCECDCGKQSEVWYYAILNNGSKGCVACGAKRHGLYKTPTWNSWSGAKSRCTNTKDANYPNYGARGIKICKRWNKFENFVKDMGIRPKGLTLDRIDNNGNYKPDNCRWATYSMQNSNQRRRNMKKGSRK